MRAYLVLVVGIAALGVWLLLLADSPPNEAETGIEHRSSVRRDDQSLSGSDSMEIERITVHADSDAPIPWQDADGELQAAFLEEYSLIAYSEGGLERAMEAAMQRESRERAGPYETFAQSMHAKLADSGAPTATQDPADFTGLVAGGDIIAGGLLSEHASKYRIWTQDGDDSGYELPVVEMNLAPLRFPPELWVARLSEGAAVIIPGSPTARELGLLRDAAIFNYGMLQQDAELRLLSLIEAASRVGISVPHSEYEAAFRQLCPEYDDFLDARDLEPENYLSGIMVLVPELLEANEN